ncbi:MAG: hypothetical protein ACXWC9_02080 [Pseudobdellovibrionaceae bacterium]
MKSLILLTTATLILQSTAAFAAIVCEGESIMGKMKVTLDQDQVTTEGGALKKPVHFKNVSNQWDGHMTGLVTAPGFSMKYENIYGCIRNVLITSNVRDEKDTVGYIDVVSVAGCNGGSTPDDICFPKK